MANYFRTYTGRHVDLLDPKTSEISIFDIARSLSHLCRFLGHTTKFYSVAQHSILVSQLVPKEDALWGLLHDASEAYTGDLPRPFKGLLEMVQYRIAEGRLMVTICDRYNLRPEMPRSVIVADRAMLATEFRDVTSMDDREWIINECGVAPLPTLTVEPWLPKVAETRFLDRFTELTA
ncbi:MAG TPA: hypothetical protein VFA33_06250 [Bryobacteraceae bacterium]|nr:hypothetical protein [Bryobacteraceae bacterium]